MTPYHFNNMGLLLLTFTLLWFYFTFAEYLTAGYGGDSFELAVFWSKLTGKYAPLFWPMTVLCFFFPFPILVLKRTIPGLFIASISIVIGMWLERYLIIIPSFSEPRLPYLRGRLHAVVGGMVPHGRPLCRFHPCLSPLFKVLSCDLHLGNRKRSQREERKIRQ